MTSGTYQHLRFRRTPFQENNPLLQTIMSKKTVTHDQLSAGPMDKPFAQFRCLLINICVSN